ncbi:alkaline phosphatase PhoX [Streptomyces sp. CAU 1734]|uniref:alkaline phosphatase PhoX n=1 Tax=Streptomyces sp. CAU 1734 TaxID=3140360 RepID=UPI003260D1F5
MPLTRRDFTRRSALSGAGIALTGAVGSLATAPGALAAGEPADPVRSGPGNGSDETGSGHDEPGYGPLLPDPRGVLALPAGFSYRVITHSGVTRLETGEYTPSHHDGAAAFPGPRGATLLVANHELRGTRERWPHPVPLAEGLVYDPAAAGGCSVVEVRPQGEVTQWVGIAGTSTNCAGGSTPWGTWLTCEETEELAGENGMTRDHGYVFEVDPADRRANRDPRPVRAFGRYAHEAVVIDPQRGHAYLTEDADGPNGLLYRWVPPAGFRHGRGRLRTLADDAGTLQAARCFDSVGRLVDDLSRATRIGTVYGVDWADVPDRDARTTPVRRQFADGAITRGRKLEGMWWGDGGAWIVSSYARAESPAAHDGQVWFYHPKRRTLTLKVLLGAGGDPERAGFDGPDNITVSPHGGLIIAEDGAGGQHLFGATERGRTYPIARNERNLGTEEHPVYSEFAGVVFSPDGRTLYASMQDPGIMFAITGPWKRNSHRH